MWVVPHTWVNCAGEVGKHSLWVLEDGEGGTRWSLTCLEKLCIDVREICLFQQFQHFWRSQHFMTYCRRRGRVTILQKLNWQDRLRALTASS